MTAMLRYLINGKGSHYVPLWGTCRWGVQKYISTVLSEDGGLLV